MLTYSNIVDSVRESLMVLDGDLRVAAVNGSFNRAFHVTSEQTKGLFLSELGNGQWDIPGLRDLLKDVLLKSANFDDYRVTHDFPDIGKRVMLLNARPLRDDNTETTVILLEIEDITDRPRAPDRFLDADERFRTLFELAPVAVYSCDRAGIIEKFNRHAAELWGREPVVGDTDTRFCGSLKLVRPDGTLLPHEQTPMADVLEGKIAEVRDAEVVIVRPDGSQITVVVNIRPLKNQREEIIGAINCFYDITDRKRMIAALAESETRYRRLFEAAHDGILILDIASRTITEVNTFMMTLLDQPREYFIGKELWEIGVFRDKQDNQAEMDKLINTHSARYENLPLQTRDGRRVPVEFVSNLYQEGDYSVIQCNIRDISERAAFNKERETLLASEQAARRYAENANRSKDLFLATLSHEVRTPLNAILGWASILRAGKYSEADVREGMEVIERNCLVQAKLIEDVLDVSRIVSGKMQLQVVPCELVDVIRAAVDVVTPAATAKQIKFETELDQAASRASCDVNRIQQVIWNLLANAVKFSPRGKTIRITLARESSNVRIQVIDQGEGLTADFLPYVFDRFRQAEGTTRRTHGGLGLGLSIVKHLVELHGGSVLAESPGKDLGATFTINLPVRAVQASAAEDLPAPLDPIAAALVSVRLNGIRVLVVDDEADARRLLTKVLGEVGAIVTAVSSAAEAFESLAAAAPQVLLSDIAMPEQDGYDLIRRIRSTGRTAKDLPAVALTAFAHKEDRLRVLLAGFQVHIAKPVDPHELIAVIASLVGRTGQ